MTIQIGNFSVQYSNYSDYDINSGEAVISTGSTSASYYFDSDATLYLNGNYWSIPGIAVGGNGNDSGKIGKIY